MRQSPGFLLVLTASIALASEPRAQARAGSIDISITMLAADSAHVEEKYVLTSSPSDLRLLTRPCATIANMRIERAGTVLTFAPSRDGPWVTFRDTTPGDLLPLVVRYDVHLTGTGVIPLVHLASPLARNSAAPLGAVSVEVNVANGAGRVVFPHMTRQAATRWSGRYVGVPSFVAIEGAVDGTCSEQTGAGGDNGGLVWRFFLLVGIMVAWVPIYLAWARRSGESA